MKRGLGALGVGGLLGGAVYLRRRRRPSFDGQRVIITGGSRGLGLELARRFAGEGARVLLVARDEEELARARADVASFASRTAKGDGDIGAARVLIRACDLRDATDTYGAVAFALDQMGGVDVLVNNAGIIQVGPVEHMRVEDFEEAMAVHLWAPLRLTEAVLPSMRRQGQGRIVNISSIGGVVAVPHLSPYCASKFALTGLSDGLRSELARYGIRVTTVTPGLMRTGSHVNALFKGDHDREFGWFMMTAASPLLSMDSGRAARRIIEACRRGRPRLTLTHQARLLMLVDTLLPNVAARASGLVSRLLPGPDRTTGDLSRPGWELEAPAPASWLSGMIDRAAERNNELPLFARSSFAGSSPE